MTMPGFSAEASLYSGDHHYATARGLSGNGLVVPQQLSVGLSDSDLYFCRLACLYCRYTGWYCWPCYICAWTIELGW
jgi:hypothetical protein